MNTYEKIVSFLKSYQKLEFDIEYFKNKMEGVKAISYSQEEKGTVMLNSMSLYMQKIDEAQQKQKAVLDFIENHFEGKTRNIFYGRYIKGMTLKEIGTEVNYSKSQVKHLHDKAIFSYLAKK